MPFVMLFHRLVGHPARFATEMIDDYIVPSDHSSAGERQSIEEIRIISGPGIKRLIQSPELVPQSLRQSERIVDPWNFSRYRYLSCRSVKSSFSKVVPSGPTVFRVEYGGDGDDSRFDALRGDDGPGTHSGKKSLVPTWGHDVIHIREEEIVPGGHLRHPIHGRANTAVLVIVLPADILLLSKPGQSSIFRTVAVDQELMFIFRVLSETLNEELGILQPIERTNRNGEGRLGPFFGDDLYAHGDPCIHRRLPY